MTKEEDDRKYQGLEGPGGTSLGEVITGVLPKSTVNWSGNNVSAPTNLSPYGGANSASSWLQSNTSSGGTSSTRPAAAAPSTNRSITSNPLTSSAGASGMMQAAASPGSIIQRSIQTALANRAPRRTGQTGALFTGGPSTAGARASTPSAAPRTLSTSSDLQAGVNRRATYQTPAQKAADPLGWANIARDLGNAGDARFRQYKTGGPGSTAAQKLVGTQKAAAKAEVTRGRAQQSASRATKAAKSKKGGKNAPKAV